MSSGDNVVKGQTFVSLDFSPLAPRGIFGAMKRPERKFRHTYFLEWREFRDMTLEEVAPQLGMTASNLSKIERGLQPYKQPMLEKLSEVLRASKGDLLDRKPGTEEDEIGSALGSLDASARTQALAVIAALKNSRTD